MTHSAALPFTLSRSDDVMGADGFTSTTEKIHGLLRLHGDQLVIQWRIARNTDRYGSEIRTDREVEPIREVVVALAALASAQVRQPWWPWARLRFVLTAADLRAFEGVAGADGLKLDHPAELVVRIRNADRMAAREFASELELAVADHALRAAESAARLPEGTPPGQLPR